MQNILVVDDDKIFLEVLVKGLQNFNPDFNVLEAKNGKRATKILESNPIDFLVTDLKMPETDGFELLAYMSRSFPSIPTIVLTAFATPEAEESLRNLGTVKLMVKPVDFSVLGETIKEGLKANASLGSLSGISLSSILQLVDMEQKTCLLEVNSGDRKGLFYFKEGKLYDAIYGELKEEDAALEMLGWDDVEIGFKNLPKQNTRRRIHATLMGLIMEASRLKDESSISESDGPSDENVLLDMADEGDLTYEHNSPDVMENADPEKQDNSKKRNQKKIEEKTVKGGEEKKNQGKTVSARNENNIRDSGINQNPNSNKGETKMADLNEVLQGMAQQIDGFIATAVVGMDGMAVNAVNPTGADIDSLAAKFAMVMKLAEKTVMDLEMGTFEENLVQTDRAWLLTLQLTKDYYLGIAVTRDSVLGNVRMVAKKYGDLISKSLR